jgi:hypothetical protein
MGNRFSIASLHKPLSTIGAISTPELETAPDHERDALPDRRSLVRDIGIPPSLLPLAAVVLTYIAAMFVIPTLAPVSISDDWTYTRSVEILVREGRFEILPVAAATMVFQLGWGAWFAYLFGLSFGVLRLSTVILTLLSGAALFGLCRELGVSRPRAALGMAAYLFNPILFTISYTFMTDPHFLALLTIASYWYVRGLRPGRDGTMATWIGSLIAALACLQRPHGALIPLGVVTFLVLSGRLRLNRASVVHFLRVVAIPASTTILYYLVIARGLPSQQDYFLDEARAAGIGETVLLIRRLTVIEALYAGLFVAPLVVALLPAWRKLTDLGSPRAWLVLAAWEAVVIGGLMWFWTEGRRMPFVPHFLGRAGPGSADLRNARPPLAAPEVYGLLTIACAAAAIIFGIALTRSLFTRPRSGGTAAGMALAIAGWQVVGVIPQSLLFRNWIISLDRYLLPLLPFAICLLLWALSDLPLSRVIGWGAVAVIAAFSIAGTRDVLVFQSNVWEQARWLNAQGVPDTKIDAGYPWDAYHLWEYSNENQIPKQTPDGSWWTDVYATATDSTYIVAGGPIRGYTVIKVVPYSAWLQREPVALHVLRRENYPGPP